MNGVPLRWIGWWAAGLMLLLWGMLGLRMLDHAPAGRMVDEIRVTGGEAVLGHADLGQRPGPRSADRDHLHIRFKSGAPEIANVSPRRKVEVRTDRHPALFLKRRQLQPEDTIYLANQRVDVQMAGGWVLVLRDQRSGRTASWRDGRLIPPEGETVYDGHWDALRKMRYRAKQWWGNIFGHKGDAPIRLFTVGGRVNCPDRWALPGIPPHAAVVYRTPEGFLLGPGATQVMVRIAAKGEAAMGFGALWLPLQGDQGRVTRLIIGSTYYRVDFGADGVTLTPVYKRDFWAGGASLSVPRSPNIRLVMADSGGGGDSDCGRRLGVGVGLGKWVGLRWIDLLGLAVLVSVLGGIWMRMTAGRALGPVLRVAGVVCIAGVGVTALLWQGRGHTDIALHLGFGWIAWGWATALFAAADGPGGRGGRLWASATLLAGMGAITLTQMALGAESDRWVEMARKHLLILAGFGWAMPLLTVMPSERLRTLWTDFTTDRRHQERQIWKWLRRGAAGAVLIFLCAQLLRGSEHGLGGWQLAELAKLVLVFVAAFAGMDVTELRGMNAAEFRRNPFPLIAGFLKFLAGVALGFLVVLLGVRDVSPVLIMGVFLAAWVWAVAPHPWTREAPPAGRAGRQSAARMLSHLFRGAAHSLRWVVLLMVCLILFLGYRVHQNPERLPEGIPQRDRFLVWADPVHHPYSGEQVRKALALAGTGGWTGAGASWFGENGAVMDLPMVWNDFTGTFVLHKFGGLAGLVLLAAQFCYILCIFGAGAAARRWGDTAGYFRRRQAGRTLHLILYGLAWMQMTHWAIAWSNTLGLLPVMGQPMSWISAAGSHLLFLALPTLAMGMVGAAVAGEN